MVIDQPHSPGLQFFIDLLRHGAHPPGLKQERHQTWGASASAVPAEWRRISHGYPGLSGERLVELAHLAANKGPGVYDWPTVEYIDYSHYHSPKTLVRHPYDDGVWLADAGALDDLPDDVTAVVSLCLVGSAQIRPGIEHVNYRLIDHADPAVNPNLDFMLTDAARTVATLRDDGHVVLIHCVAAHSRTPTVGIAYAMLRGIDRAEASDSVCGYFRRRIPTLGSVLDSNASKSRDFALE